MDDSYWVQLKVCCGKTVLSLSLLLTGLLFISIKSWSQNVPSLEMGKRGDGKLPANILMESLPDRLTSGDLSLVTVCEERGKEIDDLDLNDLHNTIGYRLDFNYRSPIPKLSCREHDSLILVVIYNATDGPNWSNKWDLRKPMENWSGVKLNENGCVKSLNLYKRRLNGEVPPEIGSLSSLESLILWRNQLSGIIPPEIGNLSDLQKLRLNYNRLTGSIPSEFGKLSKLQELLLNNNGLTGSIPPEIGNLSRLKHLSFEKNQLTGRIPPELGKLSELNDLSLHFNRLTGILPPELGNLSNLQWLGLYNNELTGNIPPELGKLSRVQWIDLSSNRIDEGIPPELGQLDSCYYLNLSNNLLEGCIPDLTNFCGIRERPHARFLSKEGSSIVNFSLNPLLPWSSSYNSFSHYCAGEQQVGAPCNDGNPATINDTIDEDCRCQGKLLSCSERDSLALIELYHWTDGPNWNVRWDLNKPMNTWAGLTINSNGCVTGLDMDGNFDLDVNGKAGNNLVGSLPLELGNLSDLTHINLSYNAIGGSIPNSICSLLNLSELNLSNNELVGVIPAEIGNLKNLKSLNLENNNLSDTLPGSMYELTQLIKINLSSNLLKGHITEEIIKMNDLEECSLYDNMFSGPLPSGVAELPALKILYLFNNNFEGCYPSQYLNLCPIAPDFSGNILVPWRGDFSKFCLGMKQIGAPCFDGDTNTANDQINDNCECVGH